MILVFLRTKASGQWVTDEGSMCELVFPFYQKNTEDHQAYPLQISANQSLSDIWQHDAGNWRVHSKIWLKKLSKTFNS